MFLLFFFFFFNDTATTEIYTLSLHDALPISFGSVPVGAAGPPARERDGATPRPGRCPSPASVDGHTRSEEHTSELQSQSNLVCRLLLEKKKTDHTDSSSGWTSKPCVRYHSLC